MQEDLGVRERVIFKWNVSKLEAKARNCFFFLGCSYRASSVRIAIRLPTDATVYFVYLFPLFYPTCFGLS